MEGDIAVWSTGDGKELSGKGGGYGGEEHVLQCVKFGSGVEVDGRVRTVGLSSLPGFTLPRGSNTEPRTLESGGADLLPG